MWHPQPISEASATKLNALPRRRVPQTRRGREKVAKDARPGLRLPAPVRSALSTVTTEANRFYRLPAPPGE